MLYDKVKYVRNTQIGDNNWLGNLRWYVKEDKTVGMYHFECISALKDETHSECVKKRMTARLFDIQVETDEKSLFEYGADYIKTDNFKLVMPFYNYGCILEFKKLSLQFDGKVIMEYDTAVIKSGKYYVCLKSNSLIIEKENGICVGNGTEMTYASVAFNTDREAAIKECDMLFESRESISEGNKQFWESYFQSCPVINIDDYLYYNSFTDRDYFYKSEDITERQLWHWWCLLINVSWIDFNKDPIYMAPDKSNWKGTWSNDGLLCMAALALTNQKDIAKKMLISYMKSSINQDGVFAWYTHADGNCCYGLDGDVGRFSHGAPYFPQVIEYYVRNTGDKSILLEDVGSMTVYEKLKKYVYTLINERMNSKYGLIEWSNLWETGWDDKGGCFFEKASLEEWMQVVSKGTDEEIRKFYEENQRPVIPIVEQVITLWSLYASISLSEYTNDNEFAEYCKKCATHIRRNIIEKCWSEKDGFYHDIDVTKNVMSKSKSADVFYWLYFENDRVRQEKIYTHLCNVGEFDCCYIPMLSKDSEGFNELGYWSGGHWPREMSFIAMGLKECGYYEKAKELIIRAIMVSEGCILPEVLNPINGEQSTRITKMAYDIMNVLALLHINDVNKWNGD